MASCSSFGDVKQDWKITLTQALQEGHRTGKLPPLTAKNRYSVHLFKNADSLIQSGGRIDIQDNALTHWSMIIGLTDDAVGCFKLELLVDGNAEEIWIRAKVYNEPPYGELRRVVNDVSINELVDVALDRIQKHGKYSALFNNCQDFVARCIEQYEEKYDGYTPTDDDEDAKETVSATKGFCQGVGMVGGMLGFAAYVGSGPVGWVAVPVAVGCMSGGKWIGGKVADGIAYANGYKG
eukprot:CAMPEP_0197057654 /NCGR_PEP_ID=MMETSP1384-20130603/99358_1 /TAXON_ID=29189 /ORGANISM="Ammonia sp." /LENGTH=236 /DNA_ID=CAMNT_0042492157 /DNA_START=152 /DNA_END=862 /DNA_ORIENTATION=+